MKRKVEKGAVLGLGLLVRRDFLFLGSYFLLCLFFLVCGMCVLRITYWILAIAYLQRTFQHDIVCSLDWRGLGVWMDGLCCAVRCIGLQAGFWADGFIVRSSFPIFLLWPGEEVVLEGLRVG